MILLVVAALVAALSPLVKAQTPVPTPVPTGAPTPIPCNLPVDGYLELNRPPTLDETQTRLEFSNNGQDTNFKVVLLIPKQFDTMAFDLEGTTNTSAAHDSLNPGLTQYWTIDSATDPCNFVCTLFLPWELANEILAFSGTRFSDSVRYRSLIQINTSMPITVTPSTLLEASGQPSDAIEQFAISNRDIELDQAMTFTRNVNTKIPFEVTFDLMVNLTDTVEITTPTPWITAALIESTLIDIDPDADPLAAAQLVFVTVIPGVQILNESAINVTEPGLRTNLNITEIMALRNCSIDLQYCIQHWLIMLEPTQCTLNGIFTASLTGTCNPDPSNTLCIGPSPPYADIVMTVTSDDFCGVTQVVDLQGSLTLVASQCNDFLTGTVNVYSNTGAAMNRTDIVRVSTSPTIANNWYLVFDNSTGVSDLSFSQNMTDPHIVVFSFMWLGSLLKCDVVATVECTVVAEFQATAPTLLALDGTDHWKASKQRSKYSSGPRLQSVNEVQTSSDTAIGADNTPPAGVGQIGGGTGANQQIPTGGTAAGTAVGTASQSGGGMSTAATALIAVGFVVIALSCCSLCCGVAYVFFMRKKRQPAQQQQQHAGSVSVGGGVAGGPVAGSGLGVDRRVPASTQH